jgi:aminoglycoside phosphotransferase (APT) family kinase protein
MGEIHMFSIGQASETLERYYGRKLQGKGNVEISDIADIAGGISNYMYSFRLEYDEGTGRHSENLILRACRDKGKLHREFQVLQKLYPTSIPVPKVYDIGEEIPGFSFIIMEKIEGQTMDKGMLNIAIARTISSNAAESMTDAEIAELFKNAEIAESLKQFSRILADINTLDWRSIGFDFLDPPEGEYGYINRQLSGLRERYKSLEIDCLNPILDWLEANKPPSDHYVLLHSDYHPLNVMVDKGEIAAIVDWEGVQIGDAAYDVCCFCFLLRVLDPLDEWHSIVTETLLGHYRETTGRELQNFDFYLVLRAVGKLFHILGMKIHGTEKLGMRTEAESLVHHLGACIEVVKEKTGIDISSAVENIGG